MQRLRRVVFAGLVLFLLVVVAGYILLPSLVERVVVELAVRRLPGIQVELAVPAVGLFETVCTDILCSSSQETIATADVVVLRYTPVGILRGRLETVTVRGLRFGVDVSGGGVRLHGYQGAGGGSASSSPPFAVFLENIVVDVEGVATVYSGDRSPVAIRTRLRLDGRDRGRLYGKLACAARGSRLDLQAVAADGRLVVRGAGRLSAGGLAGLLPPAIDLDGSARLAARAAFAWPELSPRGWHVDIDGSRLRLQTAGMTVPSAGTLVLDGDATGAIAWQWRDAVFAGPVEGVLRNARGDIVTGPAGRLLTGAAGVDISGLRLGGTWYRSTISLPLDLSAGRSPDGGWWLAVRQDSGPDWRLEDDGTGAAVTAPGLDCRFDLPDRWRCQATADALVIERGPARLRLAGRLVATTTGDDTVSWRIEGKGPATMHLADGRIESGITFKAEASAQSGSWQAELREGAFRFGSVSGDQLAGRFSGRLPLALDGAVSVGVVRYGGFTAGPVHLSVQGENTDAIDLSLRAAGLPPVGFELMATGRLVDGRLEVTGKIPEHSFADIPLEGIGTAGSVVASGRVRGSVAVDGRLTAPKARLDLELTDGRLRMPDRALTVDGLVTRVHLDLLPVLASRPAVVRFAGIRLGDYRFGAGSLTAQLQHPLELVVDRAAVAWAGGTVRLAGLRLRPGGGGLEIDLACDRLNLAELLRQFGIDNVEGEGSVNGHIPLVYRDGRFWFGDGFLYSTPGDGGIIRIGGAGDLLTSGIAAGSARFMQLDFAQAVLRNFRYEWVKIALSDDGDDVVLAMQLFGRPARPVPFRYDERLGVFRRLEVEGEAGIDREIRLDVNFRIPFNELLGYGTTIQKAMETGR